MRRVIVCVAVVGLALTGGCSSSKSGNSGSGGGGGAASGSGGSGNTGNTTANTCAIFPADDAWNTDVSAASADATWTANVQALAAGVNIHPDFGGQGAYGIPVNFVPKSQPMAPVTFDSYADESDPGPYPFPGPNDVHIEGHTPMACDGDCHLLVVQEGTCMLYEGYACQYQSDGWHCSNGAKWDLSKNSYGQRPVGWTSADAAGLAVTPGILRYSEVLAGAVNHAIRFTLSCTTDKYVRPATHFAVPSNSQCDPNNPSPTMPPMGLRLRLKKAFDITTFRPNVQVILRAFQHYGLLLADNGSNFYFQGDDNPAWDDADLSELKSISSNQFEVVAPVPPLQP